ncbi:hypothetical protein J6590_091633 [Homalodisca vitripennis]|nr:hypothetical protein J6590_078743 [Homalodisca vitripennis]KAG8329212.1 hypothetical protein J6590_091633 [Homalodisca vitripennis]
MSSQYDSCLVSRVPADAERETRCHLSTTAVLCHEFRRMQRGRLDVISVQQLSGVTCSESVFLQTEASL